MAYKTVEETRIRPKSKPAGGYPVATSREAMKRRNAGDPNATADGVKPGAKARPGTAANPKLTTAQRQAQRVQPGRAGSSRSVSGDPALRTKPRTLTS